MLGIVLAATPIMVQAACGNGVRDGDEDCDGADLGGATCATVTGGFVQSGTLTCNPDCTFNTADCRRAFLASLIPARGGKNRCQLEWGVVGTSAGKGQSTRRECTDGDGQCDQDHDFNNTCAMEVQLCLNVPDPKVSGCPFATEPGKVFRVEVLQPTGDQQVATAILDAAKNIAIGAGTTANASGNAVSYSPPITTFQCGQATVHIQLRGTTGHARPGKVRIRARSSDNSGRVKATGTLLLVCNP
jgi:hypothetical protein